MYELLSTIQTPQDVKKLPDRMLGQLAQEVRSFIIESVSSTGGHFSSNLGTVELTVALCHLFDFPNDRLIWDVGHQAYAYKILTGRRDRMKTLRQFEGLSGFPKRSESPFDMFGTAHSSTSVSAALGMAVAAAREGVERQHIAVIGDGAMTAGMAFEALNHAGPMKDVNLLVILNDNDMSISAPVGALNKYLLRMHGMMSQASDMGKVVLENLPVFSKQAMDVGRKVKSAVQHVVTPDNIFTELGFHYIGKVDGHDIGQMLDAFGRAQRNRGLQFVHVVTRKGKGYAPAEADPILYHGPGKFNPETGIQRPDPSAPKPKPTYSEIFGQWLCDMAAADPKLMAITPAMCEGSGMVKYHHDFPKRYFDVAIAEQHSVTFAAGLACEGLKPVVAIYSTFLQRAYDQLIHDVALQNLDVTFALDRAGLVGADGATHAGNYDIAYLRCIPNMVVSVPSDEHEARLLLNTCYQHPGPASVRYPRGRGTGVEPGSTLDTVPIGKAHVVHEGNTVAILAFGPLLHAVKDYAQAQGFTLVDMRFVKPLDVDLLQSLIPHHRAFVTLEEGARMGGAGSAVLEALQDLSCNAPVLNLAYPDRFIDQGEQSQLNAAIGLDRDGIIQKIEARFGPFQK